MHKKESYIYLYINYEIYIYVSYEVCALFWVPISEGIFLQKIEQDFAKIVSLVNQWWKN